MKKMFLIFGMFVLLSGAACQAQAPTQAALVATTNPPQIATAFALPTDTPMNTLTSSKTPKPTDTLRPRQLTRTAVKTITPPTETTTPTRAPTYTPLPIPLGNFWSSDIKQLLPAPLYYLSGRNERYQVWRVETDGKTKRQITQASDSVVEFDISPVTGQLAFTTRRGLFFSDPLGKNVWRINVPGQENAEPYISKRVFVISWSPNGSRIAFGWNGIQIYDVAHNTFSRVGSPSNEFGLQWPVPKTWSPDSQELLVYYGYPDSDAGGVILIRADGKLAET